MLDFLHYTLEFFADQKIIKNSRILRNIQLLLFFAAGVFFTLDEFVRNVVDFGAFVDIGVKQDGLVHLSKLSKKYVSNPRDIVAVGQIVTVWVEDVDLNRKRIQLTMVNPNE